MEMVVTGRREDAAGWVWGGGAAVCASCEDGPVVLVARHAGRALAGLCVDCARHEALQWNFRAAVAARYPRPLSVGPALVTIGGPVNDRGEAWR